MSPVCRNVPDEASSRQNATTLRCPSKPAVTIMDLLTKPLKSGKAEMESPPISVKTNAQGIFLYSPPSSVNLLVPVIISTDPVPMNRRPLYRMWANA